jgi:methylisocitrate lyase
MALYPLSAWRAANAAMLKVYTALRSEGHQRSVVDIMQSRDDLYDYLDYHAYEQKLDTLFARDKPKS